MKAIETRYKGYRFRSRLEARWAVFFDTMGIQWWYEYEGFELSFDVDEFDPEEDLLEGDERRRFKENLEFAEGWYLPDFYLPELNYWIEVKPEEPSVEEKEKALLLSDGLHRASSEKLDEVFRKAETFPNRYQGSGATEKVFERHMRLGVYILYGDIPWPYPAKGNAIGYGVGGETSLYDFKDDVESEQDEYWGFSGLCWHQCRLCSKIGIGILGRPYCAHCRFELEKPIYSRGGTAEAIGEGLGAARRNQKWALALDELQQDVLLDPVPPEEQDTERRRRRREAQEVVTDLIERGRLAQEALNKHDRVVEEVLNLEFFRVGHKTTALQEAYTAARSARFEGRRRRHSG